ncbi:MAG TPA: ABC transporter ATP-binding protein, partial [Candidatus Bathyarchaeia archaeon]
MTTVQDGKPSAQPIQTQGLRKQYNGFVALEGLDLQVPEGACFGFLGPNGAGKSTTIKAITNLIRPNKGKASLFGVDVQREPTLALRRVGAVIETPEFYGYLSPLETLAYAGRLRGMNRRDIEAKSEEVLRMVKLSDWANRRIEKFSKGMKQRVAIAQALLHDPALLILDEPTSGLDPRGMAEVREIITSLKHSGRTIFMSSHLLGEVQEVCDYVALLNHGRLLLQGSVRELSQQTDVSSLVVSFAGSIQENEVEWVKTVPNVEG